jgi:putative hydrolase of the HAD superfamily
VTSGGSARSPELPERVEAVLLDAGGVLVDLDYDYVRRLIESQHGTVPEGELSRAEAVARKEINETVRAGGRVGSSWRDYFHIILGRVGVPGDAHAALIDSMWEAHQRVGLWTVACDGALDAVTELKRLGLRVGVVSNAEGTVARNLDDAGFKGSFETVVDSHLVGVEKPDPAIFRIALERMSLHADRAVYVGDLPEVDVKGARAAGIAPILVDRHDIHSDVDVPRIRSLRELPPLIGGAGSD